MAKGSAIIAEQCKKLIEDIRKGVFRQIYLLMGDEPFYPEMVFKEIVEHCIPEEDRDFNQTICYGADVNVAQVISVARRFPMMYDRQLVVVKEAQLMKDYESLSIYCSEPLDSTVLVILMSKASADKRKALYKSALKNGAVVDSQGIKDYEIAEWIINYTSGRGLHIDPRAAALFGEYVGTSLSTIAIETDKLINNLQKGTKSISTEDIEKNIGISRQFSIFELTKELSCRNSSAALKIASHIGESAKFSIPAAISALYTHFSRILKYAAATESRKFLSSEDKSRILAGVNPYFYKEYDTAIRCYSVKQAMAVMSLLCDYDYLGKGGDGGSVPPNELFLELTAKILNI